MITANQIVCHLVGDYILQSDWQALGKTRDFRIAWIHGFLYALPFLFLRPSVNGFLLIWLSHAIIDHYRLAKYVCWLKNYLAPPSEWPRNSWKECDWSGYRADRPDWLKGWLMFIADNTMHILINGIAFRYLP